MDFEKFFNECLSTVIRNNRLNPGTINRERLDVVEAVSKEFFEIVGAQTKININPVAAFGSVTIQVPEIHLEKERVLKLKSALQKCDTFEILPLLSGNLNISVTVQNVFERP